MAKKKSTPERDPASGAAATVAPYVVLARKYRPTTFQDLVGQQAMVTTLRNAFATDRIAQGYMLTGVRGVGKTTTARILSRALNYERDGIAKATFDMPEFGRHCAEIMEGRHPDVLEMDAASNTGVDNVREIIESARYKPLMARYKVYLIDEVHMLSKGAFNALLKTLEEPPQHVKFIFATTEVRKVPVTVLSRTQRFDLRRVDVPLLIDHFRKIVANEAAEAEDAALSLIARACEGSVRDGLSLLDQALAMGSGRVGANDVRAMLGLADRGRIFDLIELVLGNRVGEAIAALTALSRDGAEPGQVLTDLAEAVHLATRAKTLGGDHAGEGLSAEEKRRASGLGERLSIPLLARAWQMLIKGLDEVAAAPNQIAAAEMVLIRLAFTADLPAPDEVVRALGGGSVPRRAANAPVPPPARAPALESPIDAVDREDEEEPDNGSEAEPLAAVTTELPLVATFADVVALAGKRRDAKLKVHLEEHVSLVRFDPAGSIELHLLPGAPKELPNELREKLNAWTAGRWMVAVSMTAGAPPLGEVERARAAAEIDELRRHPAVAAVLRQFPDAEISSVRPISGLETDDTGTG
ncbi:MAG TPA: DNA polymerase III subunit gamma/tau [Hyphomicrobiaceae bacterium]|nr:DNA polymerase III subunit gamma/tau [Hyphomicrobiaceae bacterium]